MKYAPNFLAACVLLLVSCGQEGVSTRVAPEELRVGAVSGGGPVWSKVELPGGKSVRVELARTPEERARGLMHRAALDADAGMLFVFEAEQPLVFWMKNTFVDLDMLFIGADKKITSIEPEVPHSRADTPENEIARRSGAGLYVLELPAGAAARYGLKPGDTLGF